MTLLVPYDDVIIIIIGFSYVYHVRNSRGDDFALVSHTDLMIM